MYSHQSSHFDPIPCDPLCIMLLLRFITGWFVHLLQCKLEKQKRRPRRYELILQNNAFKTQDWSWAHLLYEYGLMETDNPITICICVRPQRKFKLIPWPLAGSIESKIGSAYFIYRAQLYSYTVVP